MVQYVGKGTDSRENEMPMYSNCSSAVILHVAGRSEKLYLHGYSRARKEMSSSRWSLTYTRIKETRNVRSRSIRMEAVSESSDLTTYTEKLVLGAMAFLEIEFRAGKQVWKLTGMAKKVKSPPDCPATWLS